MVIHIDLDHPRVSRTGGEQRCSASRAAPPISGSHQLDAARDRTKGWQAVPAVHGRAARERPARILRARCRTRRRLGTSPGGFHMVNEERLRALSTGRRWARCIAPGTWRRSSWSIASLAQFRDLDRARQQAECRRPLNHPRFAGVDPRALPDERARSTEPLVLRGLAAHWPMVRAARESPRAAVDYLIQFYRRGAAGVDVGLPEIGGRFFYNDDLSGFNFRPEQVPLDVVLDTLRSTRTIRSARRSTSARPPSIRAARVSATRTTSTSARAIRSPASGSAIARASPRITICRTISPASPRADGASRCSRPTNLPNLYIGPLDFTPAGQAISLVDFAKPGLRALPALRRGAAGRARRPSSSPATRSSSRACGGITSRRSTPSTCW